MQVRRETLKPADRLWIAIRTHSDVMHAVPHVDPRCIRVDYLKTWVLRLQSSPPFFSLFPVSTQFSVGHDSRSSLKNRDRLGPVTIG
jgi:hypothetical protein